MLLSSALLFFVSVKTTTTMTSTTTTILITGGGSGIGLQLARTLSADGHTVLICGRSEAKLREAARQLPQIATFACDISEEKDCLRLYDWVQQHYPGCNWLINNAAIAHRGDFLQEAASLHHAEKEFQTNCMAPIRLSYLFLPHLLKQQNSRIINISTGLVYAPLRSYPFYNATKAALHSFTRTLRMQLRNKPVHICEVLLPVVDTPWHKGRQPAGAISPEEAVKEMLEKIQMNKEEIRVGKVKLLYLLARLSPALASGLINRNA